MKLWGNIKLIVNWLHGFSLKGIKRNSEVISTTFKGYTCEKS